MLRKIIVLGILCLACPAQAEPALNFPFVQVRGIASQQVPPDQVEMHFDIKAFHKEAASALSQVNATGVDMLAFLKQQGVASQDIVAHQVLKNIVRGGRVYSAGSEDHNLVGYDISQSFQVTLRDIRRYSVIMAYLLAQNNMTNLRVNFNAKDRKRIENNVLQAAGADAQAKGLAMAEAVGSKLGEVYAVTEGDFHQVIQIFGSGNHYEARAASMMGSNGFSGETLLVPTHITISKSLHVLYKLR